MDKLIVSPSPHLHTKTSTKSLMRDVVIALLPAVVVSVLFYGWSELLVLGVSVASCVLLEYLITKYLLTLESHLGHTLVHNRVAREVNEGFGCGEKGKFLTAFVRHGSEVLLMCLAKKGEDANGGLYDFPQRFHFTGLRYGSLEECQLRSFPHPPNRQWNANL